MAEKSNGDALRGRLVKEYSDINRTLVADRDRLNEHCKQMTLFLDNRDAVNVGSGGMFLDTPGASSGRDLSLVGSGDITGIVERIKRNESRLRQLRDDLAQIDVHL